MNKLMDQIPILLHTCSDISTLFQSPFPLPDFSRLSRLTHTYLCFLLSLFNQTTKVSVLVVSEARVVHLSQSALQTLKSLSRLGGQQQQHSSSKCVPLLLHEPLDSVILELGLSLCEYTGTLCDSGKRSRTLLMMGLVGRYVKVCVGFCSEMGEDERKRIFVRFFYYACCLAKKDSCMCVF